jgi:hypothetical protein
MYTTMPPSTCSEALLAAASTATTTPYCCCCYYNTGVEFELTIHRSSPWLDCLTSHKLLLQPQLLPHCAASVLRWPLACCSRRVERVVHSVTVASCKVSSQQHPAPDINLANIAAAAAHTGSGCVHW